MIHQSEMWDAIPDVIEDPDEPKPSLVIVPAPHESFEQRVLRDFRALDAEFTRQFTHDMKEIA